MLFTAAHIRAVHDRWASSGAMQNPPNHTDRGGLTARAGNTNAQTGVVKKLGEKPRAGDDGAPTRRAAWTSGTVSSTAAEVTKI